MLLLQILHSSYPTTMNLLQHLPSYDTAKRLILMPVLITAITLIPLSIVFKSSPSQLLSSVTSSKEKECNIFRGNWVPYPKGPNYTSEQCPFIVPHNNCIRSGRLDTQFMNWRWRPMGCELPLFDALQFLELVRGKSMAFIGDSVAWNQVQSLLCLLLAVAYPENRSNETTGEYSTRWFYPDHQFTLATFWSPFLVKAQDSDPNGPSLDSSMNLYLDQPDEEWATQIQDFDFVIISAGHWFFRPLMHYIDGQLASCHKCKNNKVTPVTSYYGYSMAFQTTFSYLQTLENYKGITFMRTFSPSHFENGEWNSGGDCLKTRPARSGEAKLEGYTYQFYKAQIRELDKARRKGKSKGLKFKVLAATEAMVMRPDGHPSRFGYTSKEKNMTVNDCVHWCLPGPIDTWNDFLLYIINKETVQSF
ncbi:Protein trichome birefringence-like 19 [Linum grandiflorum]